jgi:outer membrane immunogenic protein
MNRVVVACVGLLALAGGSATAADLPRYYQPGPAYNPIYTWTGFYLGINGGGGWGRSQSLSENIRRDYKVFGA